MASVRPTVTDLVAEVSNSLVRGDEEEALRLCFHFVEIYDGAPSHEREVLTDTDPGSTGNLRFDALVAAVVEFCCATHGSSAPGWVDQPGRFLERWWFVSGMRAFHANAIAHSPISFARRGVFVTQDALTYA